MRQLKKFPFKGKAKFALVVDGECEFWYIQMLKRNERQLHFDLKPEIPQKKTLEEQYKRVVELANDYDKVFWIIDCDVIATESRLAKKGTESAQQKLEKYLKYIERFNEKGKSSEDDKEERIIVIKNNPCLEYWLLLHFEETAANFSNCNDAGRRLKKHLSTYEKKEGFYTKQDKDIYLELKPHLSKAIKNAIKITDQAKKKSDVSISQMHLLFEALGIK